MTRRMPVGPLWHASHRLDRAFDPAGGLRHFGSHWRQPAGDSDSERLGEPRPVRLTVTDAIAVAVAVAETKPISNVHASSDGGDISQGDDRRR
jgi:hypothetical protein